MRARAARLLYGRIRVNPNLHTPSGAFRVEFKVILEYDKEERCWVSYVPSLEDISTWGRTREEALKNAEEAILGYLEAAKKERLSLPGLQPVEVAGAAVSTGDAGRGRLPKRAMGP